MSHNYTAVPTQQPPTYSQDDEITPKVYPDVPPIEPVSFTGSSTNTSGPAEDDFMYGVNVSDCDIEIRMGFIRKVYCILGVQILFTAIFSLIFSQVKPIQQYILTNNWVLIVTTILTFINLFALIWKRKSHPVNFILLSTFTFFESINIGTVVSLYDHVVVIQAVLITLGLFAALTLIAMQSKYDFTSWQPYLATALWGLVLISFVQIFFPFGSAFNFAVAVGSAILFSGFVVVDTQMIMSRFNPDEYIMASIELYLDLLNLFLAILQILGGGSSDD